MICKAKRGKSFGGLLRYALGKGGGLIIASNLSAKTHTGMAKEMNLVAEMRPGLGLKVQHCAISLAPKEKLSPAQWAEVAEQYQKDLGYEDCQFLAVLHEDTENQHLHFIANRVSCFGTTVSDSGDFKKQEKLMRKLEAKYGLTPVNSSIEAKTRQKRLQKGAALDSKSSDVLPPTHAPTAQGLRGATPQALKVQQALERIKANNTPTLTQADVDKAKAAPPEAPEEPTDDFQLPTM